MQWVIKASVATYLQFHNVAYYLKVAQYGLSTVPYSGKFSLVYIFAEKGPGSSEEIFVVIIFAEHGTL